MGDTMGLQLFGCLQINGSSCGRHFRTLSDLASAQWKTAHRKSAYRGGNDFLSSSVRQITISFCVLTSSVVCASELPHLMMPITAAIEMSTDQSSFCARYALTSIPLLCGLRVFLKMLISIGLVALPKR